ncbi:MAG TPA: hypothetical protein VFJ94_02890 [Intrasporangium sp.]|uniref:hypothetical protein n=1 Tax=Intrasporangium sp. TaxID=1925024 RepID=UPI002D7A2A56|nr:hypothetical protein [Intrasporangium sp.]HET7397445.1 hypothetical protein [Intrasporangium sp.]
MMLIDCQTCPVRDVHCADCMVTALSVGELLADTARLDPAEQRAVSVLVEAGLVSRREAAAARAVREPAGDPPHRARSSAARTAGLARRSAGTTARGQGEGRRAVG